MDDLYSRVKKPNDKKSKRRDPWVIILAVIAIVVLIAVVAAVYYWFYLDDLYYDYVADLSNSTTTMYDEKVTTITVEGEEAVLNVTDAYSLYGKLTASKQFRTVDEVPDEAPGIFVPYPDGSSLSIWYTDIDVSTWTRDHGICVEYIGADGDVFRYITDRVVYSDLIYFLTK